MSVRRELDSGFFRVRLIVLVVGGVTAALLALGVSALLAFDRAVAPELENRTRLIGAIVRGEIQQAVELGIPVDAIAGLDRHLGETLGRFGEVERIAVRSMAGELLAEAARGGEAGESSFTPAPADVLAVARGAFVLPVLAGNELVGDIVIEVNSRFVHTRLRDIFLDVLVVALVASVIAVELVFALAHGTVGRPFDRVLRLLREQRQGIFAHVVGGGGLGGLGRAAARFSDHALDLARRLATLPAATRAGLVARAGIRVDADGPCLLRLSDIADIRLALFLFSVGTEVATAFLPLYARDAGRPPWLSSELAAALPLLVYLLAIAIMSPFAGALARRFGPRRLFVGVLAPAAVTLLGMGLSTSVVGITAWRAGLALCYALGTIACQEYALRAAAGAGRAAPIGVSVTVIFGGVFCGSALGGLLAERFGFAVAFAAGAVTVLAAALPALLSMRGEAGDAVASAPAPAAVAVRRGWGRLAVLLLAVAVPANATTAIVVWYLSPLLLAELGSGPAEIARVVMLYYLVVMLVGGTASQLADRRVGPLPLVVGGALLSAAALLHLAAHVDFWGTVRMLVLLGIGHAMLRAPMHALALRIGGADGGALSALRLGERIGALLGLLVSAVLLGHTGIAGTIAAVGWTVLCGALVCATVESIAGVGGRRARER
ncbi:MFS transporter [Thauera sp. WH-1]|uniref:MFS transporter n=1 Tax=Thauera sp. WH-1 TaxID=3398230 RepID=UPI0039FC7543